MDNMIKIIGSNIKKLRVQSKLSQESLAVFLGVDQSFISKIEKGERTITSDMLDKISELFGITLGDISNDKMTVKAISFALRADEINENDLETIRCINKLVLNLNFMQKLIEEDKIDG